MVRASSDTNAGIRNMDPTIRAKKHSHGCPCFLVRESSDTNAGIRNMDPTIREKIHSNGCPFVDAKYASPKENTSKAMIAGRSKLNTIISTPLWVTAISYSTNGPIVKPADLAYDGCLRFFVACFSKLLTHN